MTGFGDQVFQYGGQPVGASLLGMDSNSTSYFVDKKSGADGNSGKEPIQAFATIERALAVAGAWDVIYVLDPSTSASDPLTYKGASANQTIPVASKGLSLIGASSNSRLYHGKPMSPTIETYGAATPLLQVNAPLCAIEGFRFAGGYGVSGSETAGINVSDFSEGVYEGYGLSIHNCYFEEINSVGDLGAIALTGQWNCTVTKCSFLDCEIGISVVSSGSTIVNTNIDGVKFMSRDGLGTKIICDIYIYAQGESGIFINDFYIAHDAPLHASKKAANIVAVGGAETGLISNGYYLDLNGTIHATTGTTIRVPATIGVSHVYNGDNVAADVN